MPRRPATFLLAVLGCAGAAALVHLVAFGTSTGARADAAILDGFAGAIPWLDAPATDIVRLLDPGPYVLLGGALAALALAQSHARHAIVTLAVLGGAAATSQVMKHVLASPRPFEGTAGSLIPEASWPSGHTTGVVALALTLVLVAPPRLRRAAAAAGAGFAGTVALCLLLLGAHFPSDVLGGVCVGVAWFALGIAALRATDARAAARALRPQAVLVPSAGLALVAAVAVLGAVVAQPADAVAFAEAKTTFVTAACALALAAAALVASAAVALRRQQPHR